MNKTTEALKRVEVWVESLTGLHTDVRQEQGEALAAIRAARAHEFTAEQQNRFATAFDEAFAKAGLPQKQAEHEPGFYGRAAARLSQRVKELELEQSGKWRDHVEHRMLTWKTSHMNESGDQLSLKDFMDEHILDDLIDFVCDEYIARTKDLTDDEISRVWMLNGGGLAANCYHEFTRAVIAAFKEKNK